MAKKKVTISAGDFVKIGELYEQEENIEKEIAAEIDNLQDRAEKRLNEVIDVVSKVIGEKPKNTGFSIDDICRIVSMGKYANCGVWIGVFQGYPICQIPSSLFLSGTNGEISDWAKGVLIENADSKDQKKKLLAQLSPAEKELLGVRE